MNPIRLGVVLWVAFVGAGFAQMAVSIVTEEPATERGFVSGVVLSLMLITAGWLAAWLMTVIAERKFGWDLAVVLVVSAWLVGGPLLVLLAPQGSMQGIPLGPVLALASGAAVLATVLAPGLTILVIAYLSLAWLARRIPQLQRLGVVVGKLRPR